MNGNMPGWGPMLAQPAPRSRLSRMTTRARPMKATPMITSIWRVVGDQCIRPNLLSDPAGLGHDVPVELFEIVQELLEVIPREELRLQGVLLDKILPVLGFVNLLHQVYVPGLVLPTQLGGADNRPQVYVADVETERLGRGEVFVGRRPFIQ